MILLLRRWATTAWSQYYNFQANYKCISLWRNYVQSYYEFHPRNPFAPCTAWIWGHDQNYYDDWSQMKKLEHVEYFEYEEPISIMILKKILEFTLSVRRIVCAEEKFWYSPAPEMINSTVFWKVRKDLNTMSKWCPAEKNLNFKNLRSCHWSNNLVWIYRHKQN